MFDARKLLGELIGAGSRQHSQPTSNNQGMGGLGDLLGQVLGGGQSSSGGQSGSGGQGGLGGLGDLLGKLGGGQAGGGQTGGGGGQDMGGLGEIFRKFTNEQGASGGQGGGGLGDLLGKLGGGGQTGQSSQSGQSGGGDFGGLGDLLGKLGGGGQASAPDTQPGHPGSTGSGSLMDILGQVLGQATDGVKDGAGRISDATGAGDALDNISGGAGDMMGQLKDLIANNKLGAGVAAGGLGALVLGTKTGRGLAADAAKLGGLVLIGGLAYKAYQNHQQGRPLLDTSNAGTAPAPDGSGYETGAVTNEAATVYIRGMIAAAAADGRVDAAEQEKIFGSLKQAGLEDEAFAFMQHELNNPATVIDLVDHVRTPEEGVQLFTAARLAIDFDNEQEQQFLLDLAGELGLEPELVQHVDAAARGTNA